MRYVLSAGLFVLLAALFAAPAGAAPVTVLDGDRAVTRNDPFLPRADLPTPPRGAAAAVRPRAHAAQRGPSLGAELARLLREGQIDQAEYDARLDSYRQAKRAYRALTGTRRVEMRAVIRNLQAIARAGDLTASRLEPLFLILDRNREWWTTGPLIPNGRRVTFEGTQLILQYYRGQGLQIQPLANFGRANALWRAERERNLRRLLDELVAVAAERGGAVAWEYYFNFGGGSPPWTSGLSQGTAIQALARGADLLGEPAYRDIATRGLGIFEQGPPTGVRVSTDAGSHYLIYSFAPSLRVLNGFLQSVIGLYDFSQLTGDSRARALFEAGEAEARVDVPRYDTGAWSLYSLERESDVSYHTLVRDFLRNLCERLNTPVYCDTADRFTEYLTTAPVVTPRTRRIRTGRAANLRFRLSKISRVGLVVIDSSGRTVFGTSATVGYGTRSFRWSRPARAGNYTLRVTATDLAGNRSQAEGPLQILPRR
jgi:D-glucuronyl C5-epimerase C-terminus